MILLDYLKTMRKICLTTISCIAKPDGYLVVMDRLTMVLRLQITDQMLMDAIGQKKNMTNVIHNV